MGLTAQSSGRFAADRKESLYGVKAGAVKVAFAGNPNVGKSTLFNRLTGKKQHTGNWPGKTVSNAVGIYRKHGIEYALFDLPGTYSLMAHSAEEEVARDFLCFENPDVTVVVCDATCLERNLNLVLQASEISKRVIVAVNLLDEARKKGIVLDLKALEKRLGLPVLGICARSGEGIKKLTEAIANYKNLNYTPKRVVYKREIELSADEIETYIADITKGKIDSRWAALRLIENNNSLVCSLEKHLNTDFKNNGELQNALLKVRQNLSSVGLSGDKLKDWLVSGLILTAEDICDNRVVRFTNPDYRKKDLKLDRLLTGKITGPLVMVALLAVVFWITITGANYPSNLLWTFFSFLEGKLLILADNVNLPAFLSDMLIRGVYRVLSWVVSAMLPPMAIFFPIFTLLEDVGYLPRIAFNMDHSFKKCSACGKQALTICMGFGCNAAGITGCRIIDSKRERLIAIITNNFVPCNGRFPTLIAIISMFFVGISGTAFGNLKATLILTAVILLGIGTTFLISKLLAVTILKGQPSSFTLELPPYRKPQIGSVIVRSIFDRTIFVLLRAMSVAAPAGLIIWLLANITVNETTLLSYMSGFLDPFGRLLGMDGIILLGFVLGFPANEIVIPIIIMAYMGGSVLTDYSSLFELKTLLESNGWTTTTALCTMIFSLMHWPCSTALMTAKKETGSLFWSFITFIVPTVCGMLLCFLVNFISKLIY